MNKYYLMLIFSVLLFSVQFVFTKCYQRERGAHFSSSILQIVLSSIFFILFYFILNDFKFGFTLFSFVMALLYAINGITATVFGMKVLERANLSVYTLFLMLGGVILPFFYGLFIGESLTVFKVVAVILIALSLFIGVEKDKDKKANAMLIICCMVIFLANGFAHILTHFHQRSTSDTLNTSGFLLLSFTCKFVISGVIFAVITCLGKQKSTTDATPVIAEGKSRAIKGWVITMGVVIGYAAVSGLAQFISAYTSIYVDAGIKAAIITGGCIFMSIFFGLIFGEKITAIKITQLLLAVSGVILIML